MNKEKQIAAAIDFIHSIKRQNEIENNISRQFKQLNPDNQIFSLVDLELIKSYEKFLYEVIGSNNCDWVDWWIYETDFGDYPMTFEIDQKEYNTKDLSLKQFLELVWNDI
jgi:hypothetical protein